MVGILSKTGLLASNIRPVQRFYSDNKIELVTLVKPAPFILKPLAGLYNPYPSACSLLCNHPTPPLPVPAIKKHDGFHPVTFPNNFEQENSNANDTIEVISDSINTNEVYLQNQTGAVPEELFRRYTETDSRPLTPTPTIASATTTGIGRRCLTPQPVQKPKLIVDLRRTHSQETLSWTVHSEHGRSAISGGSNKTSGSSSPRSVIANNILCSKKQLTPVQRPSRNTTPRSCRSLLVKKSPRSDDTKESSEKTKNDLLDVSKEIPKINQAIITQQTDGDDESEIPRRRGRKKKARSRAGTAIKTADNDPETQVASILLDVNSSDDEKLSDKLNSDTEEIILEVPTNMFPRRSIDTFNSFLDSSVIKILRRELTQEIIDLEFDTKRKIALEEALKCSHGKQYQVTKVDGVSNIKADMDLWLTLPRNYSIKNARFELPLEDDEFEKLTPLEYLGKYVIVTEKRRTLINFVFNRYKEKSDDAERFMLGRNIFTGLGEVMGQPLNEEQRKYIYYLVNWKNDEKFNFRTFSSICVLCERIFAHEYWPTNPIDKSGNEMEKVDFETLPRKFINLQIHPQLKEILMKIRSCLIYTDSKNYS